MAAWSNLVVIISMDLHPIQPVDWALITGQIGWKFTEITYYACLVKFGGHNLNGFTPNLTGHKLLVKLGVKSLRLHCIPAWSNWVSQ